MSRLEEELIAKGVDVQKVRLGEDGCVVNSLRSITGKQPTDSEWFERARQVAQNRSIWHETFKRAIDEVERLDFDRVYSDALEREFTCIEDLVKTISGSGTPMGEVLRGMEVERVTLSPMQLRGRLEKGEKVILSLESGRFPYSPHAAHVGIDDFGKYVSISDGGIPILGLDQESNAVLGFVFRKRE